MGTTSRSCHLAPIASLRPTNPPCKRSSLITFHISQMGLVEWEVRQWVCMFCSSRLVCGSGQLLLHDSGDESWAELAGQRPRAAPSSRFVGEPPSSLSYLNFYLHPFFFLRRYTLLVARFGKIGVVAKIRKL